jgi:hypothetical protein
MQEVSRRAKALSEEVAAVEAELGEVLTLIPNPPDPTRRTRTPRCARWATRARARATTSSWPGR